MAPKKEEKEGGPPQPPECEAPEEEEEEPEPVLKRPAGKAKAKAKSAAKAKGQPKQKAKAVKKKLKEKKSRDKDKDKDKDKNKDKETGEKPKPKAKAKSLKEMTEQWKTVDTTEAKDTQEVEEEEMAEDDEEEEEEKELRDYHKARKWARMMKSNSIPEDLKAMYENGGKSAEQPRLWQTKFINAIFTKTARGEYLLSPGNPSFTSFRENTESKTSTKGSTGVPYSIMLWTYFHGREDALADAEKRGDIWCADDMWFFRTQNVSRSKTAAHTMKLSGGEKELTLDQFQDLSSFLGSRPWAKFGSSEELAQTSTASSSAVTGSKELKAICDKPVLVTFASMEETLKEAKGAQERLLRDSQRLASKIAGKGDGDMVTSLKTTIAQLSKNESSLNEALLWKEIPETNMEKTKVEAFMKEMATCTEKSNEMLEQIKATCKARGWN